MTQPLRRLHWMAWMALAIALPLLLLSAVAARRPATPPNPLSWERLR